MAVGPFVSGTRASSVLAGGLLVVLIALACWLLGPVLLLTAAGLLVAIFVRSAGAALARLTRLPMGASLPVAVVLLLAAGLLLVRLIGDMVEHQGLQLLQNLPESLHRLEQALARHPYGQWLLAHEPALHPEQVAGTVAHGAASTVTTAFAAVGGLVLLFFLGLFLAFQPALYRAGLLALVPVARRSRAGEVLDELGLELRWWMVGQGVVMIVIGLLLTAGLLLLHHPLALALAAGSALVTFVPYLGAFVATGLALLVTIPLGVHLWVETGFLYLVVYLLEGYVITPLVQRGTIMLPPALTLLAQVAMGLIAGIAGVTLAAPLLVATIVVVKMLYCQDVLSDPIELRGRSSVDEIA